MLVYQRVNGLKIDEHNLLVLSREWMGIGLAGMMITSDYGSFPKIPCVKRTSKIRPMA